jgi:hypothetical protein
MVSYMLYNSLAVVVQCTEQRARVRERKPYDYEREREATGRARETL